MRKPDTGKALAIGGISGQFLALISGIFGGFVLELSFAILAEYGLVKPERWSTVRQSIAVLQIVSFFIYLISLMVTAFALFKIEYRAPWFFWMTSACAIPLALFHAMTMALAGILVLWLIHNRRTFFGKAKQIRRA